MTDIKIEIKNINEEELEEETTDEVPTPDAEGGEKPRSDLQLPLNIKKRIRALNKLQEEVTNNEIELHKTVYEIDIGYNDRNEELEEKRRAIVNGEYEPTEEDLDISPHNPIDFVTVGTDNKEWGVLITDSDYITYYPKYDENTKGIPNFWLRVFKHTKLSDFVEEHDEPLLSHLQDIKTKYNSGPHEFSLEFYFSENEYFTNKILTKRYHVKYEPQTKPYFKFEGPEIYMSEGCEINWKEGKDITCTTEIKKRKHKRSQKIRVWRKKVQRDSFFNYFKYSFYKDDEEKISYEMKIIRESDFEFGAYFKEKVIPKAYIYFTGELYENDSTSDADKNSTSETVDDGTDSSAETTNDCTDFLAATNDSTDSHSATTNDTTTGDKESPTATAGDKESPTTTTGNKESSATTTGNKEIPAATAGDKEIPAATASDKESPTATTANNEIPAATAGDKDIPAATASDKESPTTTAGDKESPATTTGNKESSATTTGNKEIPAATAGDKESPTTTTGNNEIPAATAGYKKIPAATAGDKDIPAATASDKESPTTTTGNNEIPAATAGDKESPAETAGDKESPDTTTGNKESPTTTTGNKEIPAATAIDKESPAATAGGREIASTTTGDEESPTTIAGDRESPASTTDVDKENHVETITIVKSGSAAAIDSDSKTEPHFNY